MSLNTVGCRCYADNMAELTAAQPEALWYSAGSVTNVDYVLLIDSSGSMKWYDQEDLRLDVSQNFIDQSADGDMVAVLDFDSQTKVPSLEPGGLPPEPSRLSPTHNPSDGGFE